MDLAEKTCIPCRGGVAALDRPKAEELIQQVPGWSLDSEGKRIVRCFCFQNFLEALAFVNRVGELAEEQDHHPDIKFGYGYAEVWIHTHAIGGLHENDFILAAKVNGLEQAAD
ncbi:4a-hydroxytetrahydrobiopterin dehydratase [Halorhodospira abdelmalekii]|uniref:4a-hydroxytetrahydrobiopterin dehydratase n=1 Tax=Halorhodospira abdelmalekii TaxID=421629 RepID=UPI00190755B3|nr:4a-hydroxytetrahydrobiopterin dehydratase [Halorhodospira abdelmalekii]MBK1736113.1 4a-hydroxytetrahydrobiopterin dehydratase [Halorhodospira abdelmalekii]